MTTVGEQLLFELQVPPALVDAVADEVLRRLEERAPTASPWLCGAKQAAGYLGWPVERVYKRIRRLPHYRDGNLLMFRRDELDAFIEQGYEGPRRAVDLGASRRSRADVGAPVSLQPGKAAHG